MNRNLAMSVALIATTLLVPTASAMAQNRDADIRMEAAQRRFDGELAIFRMEVERYERARTVAPVASPAPPPPAAVAPQASAVVPERAEAPRPISEDAVRELDEPTEGATMAVRPEDRDERENPR